MAVIGVGSLIGVCKGTPLAGALLGSGFGWWRPAVLCGCLSVASTAMFVTTHLTLRRKERAVSIDP
ncbi:hypothetical protein J3R83DRAFT_7132 [Lanmaoa asiatica]|nr:hypothetical protein J3R83DRAFT_7132 [Lanmaoa asiatica]